MTKTQLIAGGFFALGLISYGFSKTKYLYYYMAFIASGFFGFLGGMLFAVIVESLSGEGLNETLASGTGILIFLILFISTSKEIYDESKNNNKNNNENDHSHLFNRY